MVFSLYLRIHICFPFGWFHICYSIDFSLTCQCISLSIYFLGVLTFVTVSNLSVIDKAEATLTCRILSLQWLEGVFFGGLSVIVQICLPYTLSLHWRMSTLALSSAGLCNRVNFFSSVYFIDQVCRSFTILNALYGFIWQYQLDKPSFTHVQPGRVGCHARLCRVSHARDSAMAL